MQYDISSGFDSARKVEPYESYPIDWQNSSGTGCTSADCYHLFTGAAPGTLHPRPCDHFVPGRHAVAVVIRHRRLQKRRYLPAVGMADQSDWTPADC